MYIYIECRYICHINNNMKFQTKFIIINKQHLLITDFINKIKKYYQEKQILRHALLNKISNLIMTFVSDTHYVTCTCLSRVYVTQGLWLLSFL